MTASMWPSHEPILKAADDRLDHLLRLSPGSTRKVNLLSFQAISRNSFYAFDFLGDVNCHFFLRVSDCNGGGQRNNTFVGLNFDVSAWNTFFSQQV